MRDTYEALRNVYVPGVGLSNRAHNRIQYQDRRQAYRLHDSVALSPARYYGDNQFNTLEPQSAEEVEPQMIDEPLTLSTLEGTECTEDGCHNSAMLEIDELQLCVECYLGLMNFYLMELRDWSGSLSPESGICQTIFCSKQGNTIPTIGIILCARHALAVLTRCYQLTTMQTWESFVRNAYLGSPVQRAENQAELQPHGLPA